MRVSTGIPGLDHILQGGLLPGRVYLVHGEPGTGKTTLGLHFLSTGEDGLYITFAQSAEHLRCDAGSLGINISAVRILDLSFNHTASTDIHTLSHAPPPHPCTDACPRRGH